MFLLVGLTGGIGTGKSSVSKILRNRKYAIVDADEMARQVVEQGKKTYHKIRAEFGDEFFDDSNGGQLDREKLAILVFSDREKRRKLDSITHPEIIKAIIWQCLCRLIRCERILFLDIPLLFESKMDKFMHKLVVVAWMVCPTFTKHIPKTHLDRAGQGRRIECKEDTQIQRIMRRDGISEEDARRRIYSQMPLEEKIQRADLVIQNDGDLEHLEAKVDRISCFLEEEWKKMALRIVTVFFLLLIPTIYITKLFIWK